MKKRNLIALLSLLVAGVQTAWSQAGMLVWQNGSYQLFRVNNVDSVQFVSNASQYAPAGEFVDLALPSGTLWANFNVGASSPEDYGDYFAWGETASKDDFSWESYQLASGSSSTQNSYCMNSEYGTVDGKIMLRSNHDAATGNWGDNWQLPSMAQFDELVNSEYTTVKKTFQNDVYGMLITSNANGNSIFLPAAGIRMDTELFNDGSRAYYWSRELNTTDSNSSLARDFSFTTTGNTPSDSKARCFGLSIRPVKKQSFYPESVDLGLPSRTQWATCNVGAEVPEEYGDYFAWGETTPKTSYDSDNYFDTDDGGSTFKKYNKDGGLTKLESADDAATANWGGDWVMPTKEQLDELTQYCTITWTQQNGVIGFLVTGSNGNSIFLPAAAYRSFNYPISGNDRFGYYWSRSLNTGNADHVAHFLDFDHDNNSYRVGANYRRTGQTVRPVRVIIN